jgi:hypothetical protein
MNLKVNKTVDRFDDNTNILSTIEKEGRKSGERGEEGGNGRGSRTRGADGKGKLLPISNSGVQFFYISVILVVYWTLPFR